ncbi:MAG: VWA domain-containing protein [Opitutaceae bacterium]|nr:VWA domain-containing protein [Opitutaceae bacterium]
MNTRHSLALLAAAACGVVALALQPAALAGEPDRPPVHARADHPVVQLALLLDTSNSMDGLIDQARTRLWQIVKDLSRARQDGRRARLEVALFEYGNNGLAAESGYIRQVVAFTDDLDRLSAELFALRTNGGDEYCGAVIARAVANLSWSHRARDLKLMFIAGNEPFTQGSVDFRDAIRRAVGQGIAVNTIFCGPQDEGMRTGWKEGAMLADGTFACIDQNRRMPVIDCPQDREIARLNEELNRTYLAYGAEGSRRREMQVAQDRNAAAAAPSVAAERAATKASSVYRNSSWDLVDAVKDGGVELEEMKEEDLPEQLKGKSAEERKKIVAENQAARERTQQRIQELAREREAYLAAELAKLPEQSEASLDEAVLNSVRAQAVKVGYSFE